MFQVSPAQEKIDNIHQDSRGILNKENNIDQDSQGVLIKSASQSKSSKEYIPLRPNNIVRYNGIDDYIEPTDSPYPIVVRTPTTCYCIDGYNLVEEAMQRKSKSILCHVHHITSESELELALSKTAVRVVSDQGIPHYAELVRNCKKLLQLLMSTKESPIMHSHGGKRKGVNYSLDNKEDNVRNLIAERLGKSVSTINKYINYGDNLDDSILETLVQSKEGKRFFEAVASNKRRFIKNLICDSKEAAEITAEVSQKIFGWLEEFHESGKIKPLTYETKIRSSKKKCSIDPPKKFEHHGEYEDDQIKETPELLYQEIQAIFEALCAFMQEGVSNNNELTAIIKGELTEIAKRLCKYDALMKNTTSIIVEEVA